MAAKITTEQVWNRIEKQNFAITGFVTSKGEARTAGIVYVVRDAKIYFTSE